MDSKKRIVSVYENNQNRQNKVRVSRDLNPLVSKGERKINKTTHTVDLERVSTNAGNMKSK